MLQDQVDPVRDEMLARFVVESHIRSHPDGCDPYLRADEGPADSFSGMEDEFSAPGQSLSEKPNENSVKFGDKDVDFIGAQWSYGFLLMYF